MQLQVPTINSHATHVPATVTLSVAHLEVWVLRQDLCLSPETCTAHHCTLWQLREVLGCWTDENITNIFARKVAGQDGALWKVGRYILQDSSQYEYVGTSWSLCFDPSRAQARLVAR